MPREGGWFSDRGRFRAAVASDHSPSADREKNLPTGRNSVPPKIGIGGDIPFAEHNLVDAAGGNVNRARQHILAEVHRFQEFLKQDFAGMRIRQEAAFRRRFRHATGSAGHVSNLILK
jgi:hypothetical protein